MLLSKNKEGYNASCKINNKVDNAFRDSNVHLIIYIYTSNLFYSANRMLIGLTVMRRFLYRSPTARL